MNIIKSIVLVVASVFVYGVQADTDIQKLLPNPPNTPSIPTKLTTAEILAKSPTFHLILDASGNSPATSKQALSSFWTEIESKLREMPMGTRVILSSFGDAAVRPLFIEVRIQIKKTPTGDTINGIVADIKRFVLSYPDGLDQHGETHAIGAFFDASKNINKTASTENVIMMVSDLIENSSYAQCYNDSCKLPKKQIFSLPNTRVTVLGVGQELKSKDAIALQNAWDVFLKNSGATTVSLKRL